MQCPRVTVLGPEHCKSMVLAAADLSRPLRHAHSSLSQAGRGCTASQCQLPGLEALSDTELHHQRGRLHHDRHDWPLGSLQRCVPSHSKTKTARHKRFFLRNKARGWLLHWQLQRCWATSNAEREGTQPDRFDFTQMNSSTGTVLELDVVNACGQLFVFHVEKMW